MIRNEERSGLVFTIAGGAILLVVLLAVLGFFHEPPHPSAAGTARAAPRRLGSVAGEIVDALTGRAVAETELEVRGLDGVSDHWREPLDPDLPRHFEVKGLPAERDFTLEISAPGHVTERRATRVAAGGTTELGEIRLVPLATISGTVVDANYQPVADAEVTLAREGAEAKDGGPTIARADAHGTFRVEGLLPDRWTLSARTAAGERCDLPVTVDAEGGGEMAPIEVEVFATVSLRGRLKLPIGAVAPAEIRTGGRTAPVAGDGSFALDGLFAGPQRLAFRFGESWRESGFVGAPNDALVVDATQLVDGGPDDADRRGHYVETPNGENAPSGPCTFVVRVVDEAGRPLAGADITLRFRHDGSQDLLSSRTRATARNGETTFRAVPAGPAAGLTAMFGDRVGFNERDVVIPERPSATPFELRCWTPHSLVVKVVAPDGTPVAHAHVGVHTFSRGDTDDAGLTRITLLPPPPWKVEVDAGDAFEAWSAPAVSPDADDTVTIKLAAKGDAKPDAKDGVKNESKGGH